MNEYIKKNKVTLLLLLIVILCVSCLIIPAYAYDLGNGLYCGINLLDPYSLYHRDAGVNIDNGQHYTFTCKGNTEGFIKIQLRNGFALINYIDLFKGQGEFSYSFKPSSKVTTIVFGLSGNSVESLLYFNFKYPVDTYYLRFKVIKLTANELLVSDLMVTAKPYEGDFEPYFQNYSGKVFPLNVVQKNNPYAAMIGYYAFPRPLPGNISVSFLVEGMDKLTLDTTELAGYNIGFTRTASLEYVYSNDYINDADFYTEIPLSSLETRIINNQLINDYHCTDMTYIVLDIQSGNQSDIARIQRAVIDGSIKGYIRVNSIDADYSGAYSQGYGVGRDDGFALKQHDALSIFPSFFGSIGDFFRKFSNIEIFGISLGTVVATIVIIGVTISLYKMFR